MALTALLHRATDPDVPLSIKALRDHLQEWIDDGEWRGHSPATRALHQEIGKNLLWFAVDREYESVGLAELRAFLSYVKNGHTDPRGKWGDPIPGRTRRSVKTVAAKSTIHTYYSRLKTFFNWCIKQTYLSENPMARLDAPDTKRPRVLPFHVEQVRDLMAAARRGRNALRDEAILWMMFDTGVRASELCGIKRGELDMRLKRVKVFGKGGKERTIYFGLSTMHALWAYLRGFELADAEALFPLELGPHRGQPMTRRALHDIYARLGQEAKIEGVRCSPHTMRHSFAVEFLRAGGNLYTLMEILGHTAIKQTMIYVAIAEADMETAAKSFSPADKLRRGK